MDNFTRRPFADNYTARRLFDGFDLAQDDRQVRNILETAIRELGEETIAERELVCYASRDHADLETVIAEALDELDVAALLVSEMEVLADEQQLALFDFDDCSRAMDADHSGSYPARIAADYDAEYEDDEDDPPDSDPDEDDDADEEETLDSVQAAPKGRTRHKRAAQPPVPPQRRRHASAPTRAGRAKPGSKRR